MIIKKGDQEIELTDREFERLCDELRAMYAEEQMHDIDLTPKPKKVGGRVPRQLDTYWIIDTDGDIYNCRWTDDEYDRIFFENGSAFWKQREAKTELERRRAEYMKRNGA